jgi:rhodanese-related sulfurtransferase
VRTITVHDLRAADDPHVVDVREPEEFAGGHLPGAQLVPLATVPLRLTEFPTDRPVYLVCAVGGRSAQAAQYLTQRGVDAVNVDGGTSEWVAAGYPVER